MGFNMTKEDLILALVDLSDDNDIERVHVHADQLLLDYINDHEISIAFFAIKKWNA